MYGVLGTLVAITGYFGVIRKSRVEVAKIKGFNLDSEPHTVTITLFESGEVVHQSKHDVAAYAPDSPKRDNSDSFVLRDSLPDSPGAYELEAVMDDSTTEKRNLASEYGGSSVDVIVDIDRQQRLTFYVHSTPR